jgi:hypothetical protein
MMLGGAGATVGRLGGLGAELPVLSLTARGELVLGRVVVAEGTMDLGALSILHMASGAPGNTGGASGKAGTPSKTASTGGPGKWTYRKPTTRSRQALDYQEQVTGQPAWRVYMIDKLEFDGFNGRELLEAKGGSYKNFLTKSGTAQPWFEAGEGFRGLMEQARKQSRLAERLKLPLVWHVAEAEFANFLQDVFKKRGWTNIDVRHTPPAR